jgi:hypothetical protein
VIGIDVDQGAFQRQAEVRVMRLEYSPLNDVSRAAGSSPLPRRLMCVMFGRVSSSETNGSSMAMVEGKNRLPARP